MIPIVGEIWRITKLVVYRVAGMGRIGRIRSARNAVGSTTGCVIGKRTVKYRTCQLCPVTSFNLVYLNKLKPSPVAEVRTT